MTTPVESPVLYHDLQCRSGLGDRLLDLWAALTIARLGQPGSLTKVLWHDGLQFASFIGNYTTGLFQLAQCAFLDRAPGDARAMSGRFSHTLHNERCLLPLPNGAIQLILRTGMNWGSTSPERLHADLAFYGLDPRIPLGQITATYREVAASIRPAPSLVSVAPSDLQRRVGVHVRLGDKLVPDETSVDMSLATWRRVEAEGVAHLEHCIRRGEPLFVCSDDPVYRSALIGHLRSRGGDVVSLDLRTTPGDPPGISALVDFFALSRCTRIVQMTKHSTFSLAAALAGDIPLTNFYRFGDGPGHQLDLWRGAIRQFHPCS